MTFRSYTGLCVSWPCHQRIIQQVNGPSQDAVANQNICQDVKLSLLRLHYGLG